MHPNQVLLQRLFTALDQHDYPTMGSCYHADALFHDIAFKLEKRQCILGMWHMICEGTDIRATFEVVHANDQEGRVNLVDDYTFSDTGRHVHNVIDSRFRFQDGLTAEHKDSCDAHAWAAMALGGVSGFLAGRIRLLRSWKASQMLKKFIQSHPEYRCPKHGSK
jgi:SnoaL-like domain